VLAARFLRCANVNKLCPIAQITSIEPLAQGRLATIVHSMDERFAEYMKWTEMGWGAMLRKIDMDLAAEANDD
jgi:hypothetical protein